MKLLNSATFICCIPWLFEGFPINEDWYAAFAVCIIIDVIKYLRHRKGVLG